jgi:hypothetical protein
MKQLIRRKPKLILVALEELNINDEQIKEKVESHIVLKEFL